MGFLDKVGLVVIVWLIAYVTRLLYRTFFYKSDLNQFQTKPKDAYALVTGCTSGIGEGFAYELASRGFNLLLVSRSETKLQQLSKDLQVKYPKIRSIFAVSDATKRGKDDGVDAVVAAAEKVNLTLLVNNVGISTEHAEYYEQNTPNDIDDLITVNCRYSSILTRRIIPILRKNKAKTLGQSAAIINLSSISAYIHVPMLAIYSATKAFNLAFSNALRDELAEDNIQVLALTPGFVVSEMTKIPKASLSVASAEVCARSALNAIGWRAHAGYFFHELYVKVIMLVPASIRGPLALKDMKGMAEAKKKRLAKAAADALKSE